MITLTETEAGAIRQELTRSLETLAALEDYHEAVTKAVITGDDYEYEGDGFRIEYPLKDAVKWQAPLAVERMARIRESLLAIEKRIVTSEARDA